MKYFLLILSASLFWLNSIVGLETNGVDVLAVLKKDIPDCKLREFVQTDDHLSKLEEDLKTFCSNEQTSKTARYLCRMLIYEITIACKISKDNRPSQAKYADVASVDDVCGRKNIRLTNQWILSKVSDQDNSIGANDENLCQKIVEDKKILRLARFFYKISPNVRKYDTAQNNKVDSSTKLTNVETTKDTKGAVETVIEKGKAVVGSVVNTSSDIAGSIKDKVNSAIDTAKSTLNDTAQTIQQKGNQIADTVKQGVDAVKDKAGQAVDAVKQGAEGAQQKASETVDAAKDKAGQVVDAAKEKTGQAVDAVKQGAEATQQKVTEIIDIAKNKAGQVVEEVKDKVSTSQSVLAIGTTKAAESSVDKAKQAVDNAANKSASATTGLLSNATQDLTKDQTDKQQKVLDIAKSDKTNSNKQDEDNDDDDDQTKKENQQQKSDQTGQIQAPNVDNKKSDTKGEKSKVEAKTDEDQDGGDDDDDNQQKQKETEENGNSQSVDNPKKTKDENLDENLDKDDQDNDKVQETINTDNQDENNDNEQAEQGNFDGIEIKQANGKDKEDKIPDKELKVPDPDIPRIRPKSRQRQRYPEDEGWSGNFVTYFLVFTLVVVIGYLVLHNKNKLMAYALEGRRSGTSRTGSRPSHRGYEKLRNVNDVIPIDDTETISTNDPVSIKS